jgi:hypothetical protein
MNVCYFRYFTRQIAGEEKVLDTRIHYFGVCGQDLLIRERASGLDGFSRFRIDTVGSVQHLRRLDV